MDLAEPQKEEFIAYEGLFDTLLKLLDKKSQRASIRYLIGKLAVTAEDKARLASKFAAIPAAEGVRGESIAELRQILKDHGVIAAGGTRKKRRRANKKSRRVVRNRGIKKKMLSFYCKIGIKRQYKKLIPIKPYNCHSNE